MMPAVLFFSIRSNFSRFCMRCCVKCFTKMNVNAFCRYRENSRTSYYFSSCTILSKHMTQIYRCNSKLNQCNISSDSKLQCIDSVKFEHLCDETLDSLCEVFEQLLENCSQLKSGDVTYGDGVLTVKLGDQLGTYVINRQLPNKQIWLSSPSSGPKRYDFVLDRRTWVYRHTSESLHCLLEREIAAILSDLQEPNKVKFTQCAHYGN